ncbi:MAG: outer membrane lipoprotein chaperone LolA [Candidatus Tectomicrobia bacterium]|uniref:Outer-membrane lipoprotein carrier protein n=1 Tax=Tectimicrobiota bacterium TaxID=2528274 RepID=A0A932FY68_UNCTE|nr:outer membrane lipoprotein chaperone LolA [Candidatus Tectomicrobia bacterium]
MKKIKRGVFRTSLIAILSCLPWQVEALSLEEVVDRVQKKYEETQDFTADFEQVTRLAGFKKEQGSSGKVFMKKPGKMRWEYQHPEKQLIVSDGEAIWYYNAGLHQVTEGKFSKAYDSKTPGMFLMGLGKLKEDFKVSLSPEASQASGGPYTLELRPKDPQLQQKLSRLVITVNPKSSLVEKSVVYDPLGNVTTLRFSNIRVNVGLAPSLFAFQVPKGAERIRIP